MGARTTACGQAKGPRRGEGQEAARGYLIMLAMLKMGR